MDKLLDRLNLYDILAMIFPGGVIMWCIINTGGMHDFVKEIPWVHSIMTQKIVSSEFCFGCIGIFLAYLLGIVNHSIVNLIRILLRLLNRNPMTWMCKCYLKTRGKNLKSVHDLFGESAFEGKKVKNVNKAWLDKYAEAYQMVKSNLASDTIPTIENQIAMLRDSIIPVTYLTILSLLSIETTSYGIAVTKWFIPVIIVLVMLAVIHFRTYTLFSKVFARYNYLISIEGNNLLSKMKRVSKEELKKIYDEYTDETVILMIDNK